MTTSIKPTYACVHVCVCAMAALNPVKCYLYMLYGNFRPCCETLNISCICSPHMRCHMSQIMQFILKISTNLSANSPCNQDSSNPQSCTLKSHSSQTIKLATTIHYSVINSNIRYGVLPGAVTAATLWRKTPLNWCLYPVVFKNGSCTLPNNRLHHLMKLPGRQQEQRRGEARWYEPGYFSLPGFVLQPLSEFRWW